MRDGLMIGGTLHDFGRPSDVVAMSKRIKAVIEHGAHLAENFQAGALPNSQPPTPNGFVVMFSVGDGSTMRAKRTKVESLSDVGCGC
jgi:hypothetical protein